MTGVQPVPTYRKKPDRLEEMAPKPLLDALGTARQAVISAQTGVKVAGPVYHGWQMVIAAIDALAELITIRCHPHCFRDGMHKSWRSRILAN